MMRHFCCVVSFHTTLFVTFSAFQVPGVSSVLQDSSQYSIWSRSRYLEKEIFCHLDSNEKLSVRAGMKNWEELIYFNLKLPYYFSFFN